VVAVSQAPSPKSNPNSSLPVVAMVGQYPTIEADGAETVPGRRVDQPFTMTQRQICLKLINAVTCISSSVTGNIHRRSRARHNRCNEPFAVSP
jgi:hypothetical protein